MRHFENGYTYRHIIRSMEKLSIVVLKILVFDQPEQFSVIGAKMRHNKSRLAIVVGLLVSGRILPWVANSTLWWEEIGPHDPVVSFLHNSAEELKHLPTYKQVIAINNNKQLLLLALIHGRIPQIWHCHLPLLVNNHLNPILILHINRLYILINHRPSVILALVINHHYMIIGIVLLEDWLEVVLVTIVLDVVESGDYDADWKLGVLADVVLTLVVKVLLE